MAMASMDDPLGLDSLNTDDFQNEKDEKEEIIPTNLKDPLGLDEKTPKSGKKRRGSFQKSSDKAKKSKRGKNFGKKGSEIYPHGNYHQYYGYRNQEKFSDYRIQLIDEEWVSGQDVLGKGQNKLGHFLKW